LAFNFWPSIFLGRAEAGDLAPKKH